MNVSFRKLNQEDLSALVSISKEGVFPGWTGNSYLELINQDNSICIGAFLSNKLVSVFLGLFSFGNLDIVAIATAQDERGKGLGRRVLSEVLKSEGILSATLEVDPLNEAAVKLYLGAGFEVVGIRKKYYLGQRDAWSMRWKR